MTDDVDYQYRPNTPTVRSRLSPETIAALDALALTLTDEPRWELALAVPGAMVSAGPARNHTEGAHR